MRLSLLALFLLTPFLIAIGQQQRPNIIFILADDLGYGDIGAYGQTNIKTPVLDKLAAEGKSYTQFYAGSTVCAPSRASLMTGRHTGRGYIRGNGEIPLRREDTILPEMLKQSGYTTGMMGKWGLGLAGTEGAPEKKGWDFFSGFLHHVEGHFQRKDSVWTYQNGNSTKVALEKGTYVNEWFAQQALNFIDINQNTPFFLYVAFTLPHAELAVQHRYLDQYLDAKGNSIFPSEKAQPSGLHYGPQSFPKAAYAAMVSSVDDYTGWILNKLDELGIAENTLVIFTSDNGTHQEGGRTLADATDVFRSSGPLRGIKRDLYEGGIRIPFIARWPKKISAATTSNHIGAFWDILPTFTELAGGNATANIDGISFAADLTGGKNQAQHETLYWEFNEGGFKQALRMGNWKAIRFYKGKEPQRTELYDLSTDIGETKDLANEFPDQVKKMEDMMEKHHTSSQHPLFRIK
ncbi:arylsulfatase [Sphingobacterium alkalisoli]|uniref:Arylsulfatase n=1 Tax=Sphingobacterium alkalisoli TaxID=1874115 RepID=A0A4U0H7H5_9SPHI|nr:arylsulfatase [Sphingobacterium alkalisoli]TJY67730.1 arylsulfatase [Sphingobacterium alkalisoli]GGH11732.1 N-acetylgalactosamine-6-sulfatase [Sphingobacterium alkalisoli]